MSICNRNSAGVNPRSATLVPRSAEIPPLAAAVVIAAALPLDGARVNEAAPPPPPPSDESVREKRESEAEARMPEMQQKV